MITGDTVLWSTGAGGKPVVDIKAMAPREDGQSVQFLTQGSPENFYVYPSDVASYLGSGVLDRELFNIPGLVRGGLGDGESDTLPVIVESDDRTTRSLNAKREYARLAADADSLPATEHPVPLRTVHGAGIEVERAKAHRFWEAVTDDSGSPTKLVGDVERVMLDRPVQATLDKSVPQIGAPEVWDSGYSGEGVTVAVLDTGIDSGHPDLAGKVTAERDFTDSGSAADAQGHGTHVASTIAGSGAASDGLYKGVAPDADLMNGRVLNEYGEGRTSWVIAGMEWAAQNGADVVNMSLGECCWSDGRSEDPAAQAVNQLTAQYDTLFVISAGNDGEYGVGTPGVADAALTVGAVDDADQLADFSSRGPRMGDFAVKPNITAPGVDITAARAAGTEGDGSYVTHSGTSMAAPHVAGAAALLAQARPDLGAAELKDALASTAVDGGFAWREQGTGRVDVSRAVGQGVYAPASVDVGSLDGLESPVHRQVTYTNHTDAPVTLTLDSQLENLDGDTVADLTLSTDTVTVPANGEATITATVDPADYEKGVFGGAITATGDNVELRTAVGFGGFDLTRVKTTLLDSAGDQLVGSGGVLLINESYDSDSSVGAPASWVPVSNGVAIAYVPAGTYTIMSPVTENDAGTGQQRTSHLIKVGAQVSGSDATFTLDARDAVPVAQPSTPRKAETRSHMGTVSRRIPAGYEFGIGWIDYVWTGEPMHNFVTPTPPAELGAISLTDQWLMAEPKPLKRGANPWLVAGYTDTPAYSYHLPFGYPNGIPDDLRPEVTLTDLVKVPTRYHSEDPDPVVSINEGAMQTQFNRGPVNISAHMAFRPGKVDQYYLADQRWFWTRETLALTRPDQYAVEGFGLMFKIDRFKDSEGGRSRMAEGWFEAPLRVGAGEIDDDLLDYYEDYASVWGPWFANSATLARGGPDGNEFVPAVDLLGNSPGHMAGDVRGGNWWHLDYWGVWSSSRMWTPTPASSWNRTISTTLRDADRSTTSPTDRPTTGCSRSRPIRRVLTERSRRDRGQPPTGGSPPVGPTRRPRPDTTAPGSAAASP